MRNIVTSIIVSTFALIAHTASAATLLWVPASGSFTIGDKITVDLKIDSAGIGINAAQATIRFPKDILEVSSLDKTDSALNFWLEEPSFSNTDGIISFTGGTPYGVSGASIEVLRITFTAKSIGTPLVTIVDGAVTASDGNGTNVLSKTNDTTFTIMPKSVAPVPVIAPPKQIEREPAPATGLPTKPVVRVALYPDTTLWYDVSSTFTALWDLPRDISDVSTAINKQPNYIPQESEGLFDSKSFPALTDGTYYLHVRFKNEAGWGPVTHYRLAVDTKAPIHFDITTYEQVTSDNPSLTLKWKTSDALSGIRDYTVIVDKNVIATLPANTFKGSYTLPPQAPGKHHLAIIARDNAGNGIESGLDFETLPIIAPTFTFAPTTFFSDGSESFSLRGTAPASTTVMLLLKKGTAIVKSATIPVIDGNWEYALSDPLHNGSYTATIQAKDLRGAVSIEVASTPIKVMEKPILQIGSINITKTSLIIILVLIFILGSGSGYWFYQTRRERAALRIDLAETDSDKIFKIIENDIDNLDKAHKTPTPVDDAFATEKLRGNVKKMSGYLKKEIKRAKE